LHSRLFAAVETARAAVLSSHQTQASEPGAEVEARQDLPRSFQEIQAEVQAKHQERHRRHEEARREVEASVTPLPSARLLPARPPTAQEVMGDMHLSRGALRLWLILHALALFVLRHRGYTIVPDSVTFHLPAVIAAAVVRYSERHTYRLADELRILGLLDERGHVAQVGKLRRYSGTLWCIKLRPEAPRPRLRYWDFRHDWRPDFALDYHGEQGAFKAVQDVMSEPLTCEARLEGLFHLAKTWAAATRTAKTPVEGGSDTPKGATLRAVAHALPALVHLHPRQRHREVSRLATDIALALDERGRVKQWCRDIYAAIQSENEQRQGLSYMALQLVRLATDLAELAPWKKPGAVLAARLKT